MGSFNRCLCRVQAKIRLEGKSMCRKAAKMDTDRNVKREKGNYDGIEHFNFYSPEFEDPKRVPECIRPFMDEITAFCDVSCRCWAE